MNMRRPAVEDEDEKPLDPAVERVRRKLVRFVAINLGILLVALVAVVAALFYKSRTPTESAISAPDGVIEADILLPAGARIMSQSLSGDRALIDAELADGSRTLLLYDFGEKRIVGRFAVKTE